MFYILLLVLFVPFLETLVDGRIYFFYFMGPSRSSVSVMFPFSPCHMDGRVSSFFFLPNGSFCFILSKHILIFAFRCLSKFNLICGAVLCLVWKIHYRSNQHIPEGQICHMSQVVYTLHGKNSEATTNKREMHIVELTFWKILVSLTMQRTWTGNSRHYFAMFIGKRFGQGKKNQKGLKNGEKK